jgi:hypothetical protein
MPMILKIIRLFFLLVAPVAVGALSLSFFPPTAYLNRVRSRAQHSKVPS